VVIIERYVACPSQEAAMKIHADLCRVRHREVEELPARALAAWFAISVVLWALLGLITFSLG
jgi:hypothetical protein